MQRRSITRAMGVATAMAMAVSTIAVVATATPAQANDPPDFFSIDAGGTDFGALAGGVLNPGTLTWNHPVPGTYEPRLNGSLILTHPAGIQAQVRVNTFSMPNHVLENTRFGAVRTSTAAATDTFAVNLGNASVPNGEHVHVELWDNSAGGGAMALVGLAIQNA